MEERQTIMTLKTKIFATKEMPKEVKVSVNNVSITIIDAQKLGKALTGRDLADPQLNQSKS